jgi:hypothetical protein
MNLMTLSYPERLAMINQTQTRLTKVRLYVPPVKPCNDNENPDKGSGDASLRLMDKVGLSWHIRQASLSAIVNRSQVPPA